MSRPPPPPSMGGPSARDPLAMVHQLILAARASFEPGSADREEGRVPAELPGDVQRAVALSPLRAPPLAPPLGTELLRVITSRRSRSLRASGPLPFESLSYLLRNAQHAEGGALLPKPELRTHLFVVALDVPSLESGVYRYDEPHHRLLPIRSVAREYVRQEVLLQYDQGDAAALLFVVTPLAGWLLAQGDRGYRAAMMSLGWVVDSLYLRAEQLYLRYSATGGFALARANALLHLDGHQHTTALAFAVGTDPPAQEGR